MPSSFSNTSKVDLLKLQLPILPVKSEQLLKTSRLLPMVKMKNGPSCILNLDVLPMKKDSKGLDCFSEQLLKLKKPTKNATGNCIRIWKKARCLNVKVKWCGNVVCVDSCTNRPNHH